MRLLLSASLVLPLLVTACIGSGASSTDPADQRDDGVVTESASDKVAFDYFVGKGLTDVQAAGIVGNLDQESGMSPTISQSGGGPGRGIAQWSAGARWDVTHNDNVAWYASQHGASMYSLGLQLDFIWYELTTIGYGYAKLRAATTVTEAVVAFQDYYEICGACASQNRVAHAQAALTAFGGGGSSPPPPSGPTSCSVAGVAGVCITTSACATEGGHVSTPGHCSGAANIECCTPTGSTSSSSSSSTTSTSTSSSSSSSTSSSSGGSSSSSGGSSSSSASSSGSPAPSCSVSGTSGTCITIAACAGMVGYTSTAGHCSGPASIECCTPAPSCVVAGVSGVCINTSVCASTGGTSTPGYCPGGATEECCTP